MAIVRASDNSVGVDAGVNLDKFSVVISTEVISYY